MIYWRLANDDWQYSSYLRLAINCSLLHANLLLFAHCYRSIASRRTA